MNRKERRAHEAQGIDIGDPTVRYDGRTIEVKVVVNTDESVETVIARLIPAGKGPGKRMVVISGGVVEPEAAATFWNGVIPNAVRQAKSGGTS